MVAPPRRVRQAVSAAVTSCHQSSNAARFGAADWLSLAAAPTFAAMALLTGAGAPELLCAAGASPLSGMAPMYWLMSAFHLAPWLKLIARSNR